MFTLVNNHYTRRLKPHARNHRNVSTKAEVRMWCELLRDRQLLGYPFLRQRPIAGYIADFFCKELKLVIEVDGSTHDEPGAAERDTLRDDRLSALGYTTLRFTDEEVLLRTDEVHAQLEQWIERHATGPRKPRPVRQARRREV